MILKGVYFAILNLCFCACLHRHKGSLLSQPGKKKSHHKDKGMLVNIRHFEYTTFIVALIYNIGVTQLFGRDTTVLAIIVYGHIKMMHMSDPTCYLFMAFIYVLIYVPWAGNQLSNDEA